MTVIMKARFVSKHIQVWYNLKVSVTKKATLKWSVVQPHRASPNHGSGLSLKVDFYYLTIFMCINKIEIMYERLHTDIKVE